MSRRLIQVGTLVSHASSSDPHERGGRRAKWRNSKWAIADGKQGAAMQRRWRLPKGVLRPRFAIKKRRFPPRPCSGIDSAVAGPWQHADVNEEKAANSVLLRWTEGPTDGVAYRDMTAMHPADSTDDRAAVSPASRQAFWLVSSGPAKECTCRDLTALGHHLGRSGGRRAAAPTEFFSQVGRLRANSKVRASWAPSPGVLALLAGCAAPAPAGD